MLIINQRISEMLQVDWGMRAIRRETAQAGMPTAEAYAGPSRWYASKLPIPK
jgi:hypothetical protein